MRKRRVVHLAEGSVSSDYPATDTVTAIARYDACGVPIDVADPGSAADRITGAASRGERLAVHLCNAHTVTLSDSDERLMTALQEADLNLSDGTPIAWLGRRRGQYSPVRGPQLVGEVVDRGREIGLKHYLYGGHDGVADLMRARLERDFPGVAIVGTETPPFRSLTKADVAALADRVRASGANVLWIGLGTPRQDYLVADIRDRLDGPAVPVGAAFDFWAGSVREAPRWLHGSGVEWAYRLLKEPRRLWRRYLLGNPTFILIALRYTFSRGRAGR
ncbi:WecB/TagA/CpsF family glycosyltransferase [Nocardioides iriomotensis]|uniref:Glycosyltransferase n=1 Tax=Nocardioides iriomotensis TaxID=715784 RepID=A0A4Q5J4Y2_9ACTN|nr:WecB/TagA/CpsF family glycosyltransferase [Nocardioides iriomotensis]RYU13692.1 glycosyltransferase [Nocardioides iriomotensis]